MKYRNTMLALILLLGLGAYVYFYERTPIEETANGERKIPLLPQFDSAKITEFSITESDTTRAIRCALNKDSTWNLRSPVNATADSPEINSFLSGFKNIMSDRVLKDHLQPLSSYGLATPRQIITFKTDSQSPEQKLSVGILNPDGNEYYLKKDSDPAIYLVSSGPVNLWKKSPADFRDKTIIEFPPDQIAQITLTYPTQSLVFKKQNDDWKLTQPKPLEIDKYKIEDLLWKIHSSRVKQFVDDSPKELKSFDLDKPAVKMDITTNNGKIYSLSLSDKGPSPDLIYGKTSDKTVVFAMDSSLKQALTISNVDDLRDRNIFRFLVDDIQSLQLVSSTTVNLSKEKDDWYLTTPKKTKADFTKIQDLLWRINGLKIKDFVEDSPKDLKKYGLANPSAKVILTDKTRKTYILSLGDITKTGNAIYGKTDSNPLVFSLDTDIISYIKPNNNDLMSIDTIKKK